MPDDPVVRLVTEPARIRIIELLVWALYPACAAYNFAIDAGMALVNAIVDVV